METTTRDSEISFTVFVLGTSTSIPDCRIGAVIMKITSSTSITSTKGTMLISERVVPVWRASCGIIFLLFYCVLLRGFVLGPEKFFTQRTRRITETEFEWRPRLA